MPKHFQPRLDILPAAQGRLWPELIDVPGYFTLYGGTAIALRLAHRQSVDFDFFGRQQFDPDALYRQLPYLRDALASLECRVVSRHAAGDHSLFVAEITDVVVRSADRPLTSLDLEYVYVGTVIKR